MLLGILNFFLGLNSSRLYFCVVICFFYLQNFKAFRKSFNKGRILYIGREFFDQDMKMVENLDHDWQYLRLDKRFFIAPFDYFLPDFPRKDCHRKFWSFYSNCSNRRYERFIQKFTVSIFSFFDARAIIAPNYVYKWLQFPLIALKGRVPRIILYKEGVVPISTYDSFVKYYTNGVFEADYLGVLNFDLARSFQKSKISGINTASIYSVGSPRIGGNDIHKICIHKQDVIPQFRCVFFSFSLRNNLKHLPSQQDVNDIEAIYSRYLADVRFICKTFPNLQFGYRNKVSVEQLNFASLVESCPNLLDVSAWSIDEVFAETEIALSGPSTVLFEAACRDIHTIEVNLGSFNFPTLFEGENLHPLRYQSREMLAELVAQLPGKSNVAKQFVGSYFPYVGHESVGRIRELINEATSG